MKACLLLTLLAAAVSFPLVGLCSMPPKNRPLYCFKGEVLSEDLPELKTLLDKYRREGNDEEFADYLGDMYDKKEFREPTKTNEEEGPVKLGRCAQRPAFRPYACYAERVLRRDRKELKEAYDSLHESNLEEYNKIYFSLLDKKRKYFGVKEE